MAKKEKVQEMFNGIAPKYDLLNHLLSMGIDKRWRRKAMKVVGAGRKELVLDIACGTGDFSIEALKHGVKRVIGADISENMLVVAREKAKNKGLADQLDFQYGDSENLSFGNNTFDAVTVAFGVRNFEHLEQGLTEMCRVLRPGGKVVILEFSTPERFPMKQLYNFISEIYCLSWEGLFPVTGRLTSICRLRYSLSLKERSSWKSCVVPAMLMFLSNV